MLKRILVINQKDNVAVLLQPGEKGDTVKIENKEIVLNEFIEFGHKVAIKEFKAEDVVYKYGEDIGYAMVDIPKGAWIHNHNMGCRRGK